MSEIVSMPQPGRGVLPLSAAEKGSGPSTANAGARILIVEDDYFVASNLEHSLKEAGYDVVGVAVSAAEAEDIARVKRPALAIMDIRLAGKSDGIEAAIKLSSNYGVPSIFATAHGDAETRLRAAKANPRGWVNKPYSMDAVVAAIRSALSS
jgi:DNA-binding NarL/FixJ family response regulator